MTFGTEVHLIWDTLRLIEYNSNLILITKLQVVFLTPKC